MANFLGVDWTALIVSINWLIVLYSVLCIIAVIVGSTQLYPSGSATATIFGIGSIIIFVYFGYRWFSRPAVSRTWPPSINMCPDYLTLVPSVKDSTDKTVGGCIDMLGVSKNGGLATSKPVSGLTTATATVFPYTAAALTPKTTAAQIQEICDKCKTMGITWEGIYDGDTCVGIKRVDAYKKAVDKCQNSI